MQMPFVSRYAKPRPRRMRRMVSVSADARRKPSSLASGPASAGSGLAAPFVSLCARVSIGVASGGAAARRGPLAGAGPRGRFGGTLGRPSEPRRAGPQTHELSVSAERRILARSGDARDGLEGPCVLVLRAGAFVIG